MHRQLRIGTSGWNYKHWKEVVYPPEVAMSRWLGFYAENFNTVEVNATFYRLPPPKAFDNWYRKTPRDFLWAVKGSKFITHTRRLKDSEEPLGRLYNAAKRLREKLGPVLFQLPPTLVFDREIFLRFCDNLDPGCRHALEVRHPSWIDSQVFDILKAHNKAFCISDSAGRYPYHEVVTADFSYVRLHGSRRLYASEYSEKELQEWALKIREWKVDVHVYFDNDFQGRAFKNARRLNEILQM